MCPTCACTIEPETNWGWAQAPPWFQLCHVHTTPSLTVLQFLTSVATVCSQSSYTNVRCCLACALFQVFPLRASVALPFLSFSSTTLDFSTCWLQSSSSSLLTLSNLTLSAALWRAHVPKGKGLLCLWPTDHCLWITEYCLWITEYYWILFVKWSLCIRSWYSMSCLVFPKFIIGGQVAYVCMYMRKNVWVLLHLIWSINTLHCKSAIA